MNWSPFVSLGAFEQALRRADAAERTISAIRIDAQRSIDLAYEHTRDLNAEAHAAMLEAKTVMHEAVELSKLASKLLFGGVTDEGPSVTSIAVNDRLAAVRAREARGGA